MREFVDSTHLDAWFIPTRRDAQELLPHLVQKLILATLPIGAVEQIRIPVGDDVTRPGFDGTVQTTAHNGFVTAGLSIWEMGVSADAQSKANSDYAARSSDPQGIAPKSAEFVFVTPRHWDGREKWAEAKRLDCLWRNVRVIDATDLALWIQTAPGVARWLARQTGVPVDGLRDLDLFYRELEATVDRPLPATVLIGGRADNLASFQAWIESDRPSITIEAESPEEAVVFAAAAILELPENLRKQVQPRVLVVDSPGALDYLAAARSPHFVVATTPETRRRVKAFRSSALRMIIPAIRSAGESAGGASTGVLRLGKVRRRAVEEALKASGIGAQRASRIAQECKGSLTALLWMLATRQDEPLPWTRGTAAFDLVPIVLAGQWIASSERDQMIIGRLADRPYADVDRSLAAWVGPNLPLVRRGPMWDWLAWDFAWSELAPALSDAHFNRFRTLVHEVLGTADPRFTLPPEDRWAAALHDKAHPYSGALRSGLVGSIVQFALNDANVLGGRGQAVADSMVRDLLRGDGIARKDAWPSLAPWLPDLAEASPAAFLDCAERLITDDDAIRALFEEEGLLGSHPHVYLLWALERLAWSEEYLTRVTIVLGGLAAVDPGGRMSNRPKSTLAEVFLPWHPHTTASVEHRLAAIDALTARYPEIGWDLCVSLLPGEITHSTPTSEPRWRSWKTTAPDSGRINVPDYLRIADEMVRRILDTVGFNGTRWAVLLNAHERLRHEHPAAAARIIQKLQDTDVSMFSREDRVAITAVLRERISRHREFRDAEWAMPEEELDQLEALYLRLQPENPSDRHAWLFQSWPHLPSKGLSRGSYEEDQRQIDAERLTALAEIHKAEGINGVLAFAEHVERPDIAGAILSRLGITPDEEVAFVAQGLARTASRDGTPPALRAVFGYIGDAYHRLGDAWLRTLLDRPEVPWDAERYANLAWALPAGAEIWDALREWSREAEDLYWSRTPIAYLANPKRDVQRALDELARRGRWYRALDLAITHLHRSRSSAEGMSAISPATLINVLDEAPGHNPKDEWFPPSLQTLSYSIGEVLDEIEAAGVDRSVLLRLEWKWMPALAQGRRGLKTMREELTDNPKLFVELLTLVYRADGEEPHTLSAEELALTRQAHGVLQAFRRLPGATYSVAAEPSNPGAGTGDLTFASGEIDIAKLTQWVTDARRLAGEVGRLKPCDGELGRLFASAPSDGDGAWPHRSVRELIEDLKNPVIERNMQTGVFNSRGVHARRPGGDQERVLVAQFRGYAEQTRARWPRTAAMLNAIADSFERLARHEDEQADIEEFE